LFIRFRGRRRVSLEGIVDKIPRVQDELAQSLTSLTMQAVLDALRNFLMRKPQPPNAS